MKTGSSLPPTQPDGSPWPIQVGVACSSGLEFTTHSVRAVLDENPGWVDIALDAKNAFNSIHRRAYLKVIGEHFPGLWNWAWSNYGHPTGDQVHGSRSGGQNNSFDVGVRSDRGAKDRVAGGYGGPVSSEEGVSLLLEGGEPGIAEEFNSWTEDSRHPPPGGWVREGRAIDGLLARAEFKAYGDEGAIFKIRGV